MTARFSVFVSKLRSLLRGQPVDVEFQNEMQLHLQMLTNRFVSQGMSPKDAQTAARRQFGNATLLGERRREMSSFLGVTLLTSDVRFAIRQLRRNPTFTTVAVISLALGIGVNTAIFSVANKVLFRALPVRHPEELRMLTWVSGHRQLVPPVWGDVSSTENGGLSSNAFSYPVLEALRKHSDAFEALIAFKDVSMTATVDATPELIAGEMVSGSALDSLGVRPILGRNLNASDDAGAGKGPVAVLSESYWASRFGRSPAVLGKVISLNGVPVTVVGVAQAGFAGLQMGRDAQIFVPVTMQPLLVPRAQHGSVSLLENPESWWLQILVRLRPDVPESRVQAELDVALRQAAMAATPPRNREWLTEFEQFHLKLEPGDRGLDELRGDFAKPSYVLLALAGLVLLLACVNLANLMLARTARRQREMATRLALGASRANILRQVLTESLLLSGMGGVAGIALGFLGRNVIPRMLASSGHSAVLEGNFDWRVMTFALCASVVTGILFGVVPAWRAMHADVNGTIKENSTATQSRGGIWLGKGFVIVQIALSAILLIGAGLFVQTLIHLNRTRLGFRADHLLLFQLNPPRSRYNDAQMTALYRQLEEKLAAIAGIRSVSMSNIALVGDGNSGATFHVSGQPVSSEPARVQTIGVGADFFQTMGIPVLRGRGFTTQDGPASPPVAVINETLARQFFPGKDPIGRMFDTDPEDVSGPVQIVGIAADTRHADLRSETPPTFFMPYRQQLELSRMVVELRTAAEPGSVLAQTRAAVASLDRDLPLIDVRTMAEQVQSTMYEERVFAQLTSGFGVLALVLACIGIYGITAYTVERRTSEIAIRMALGARAVQVLGLVLRDVAWMALAGVLLGTGCALGLSRFVQSMLYGLRPYDPATLTGVAMLLVGVALLAGFGPARRAARVDAVRVLRHD